MELGTSFTLAWSPSIFLNADAGCKGRVCYILCSKKKKKKKDIIYTGVWALLSA